MNEYANKLLKEFLRENSELDFKIKVNTELNRKGFARVNLLDAVGKELSEEVEIKFRQIKHEYQFGGNLFMLEQFPSDEENACYEERFKSVFNLGVVPFYWDGLEPLEGKPRYAKDSPSIYRRPPPDLVLEFCEKNNITPKGHPLFWHGFLPDWLPPDHRKWVYRMDQHIAEIADHYADRIFIFDAINEALNGVARSNSPYVDDIVQTAFEVAERYLPNAQLVLNDDQYWWIYRRELTNNFLVAQDLIRRGIKVGGLGFQYHMFDWNLHDANTFMLNPVNLYKCLDIYGRLNIPCSLTEISLISRTDILGDGDTFQGILLDKLYRLWFSHPSTEALIYWNLVDNTAAEGEDTLRAGLLNRDFTEKPAFQVLDHLVNKEWRSSGIFNYIPGGDNRFQGFYGDYELVIHMEGQDITQKITLSKYADTTFNIKVS